MRVLVHLLMLLTVLAMLPWGAYAGRPISSLPGAVGAAAVDEPDDAAVAARPASEHDAKVSAKRPRCRGPALPGSACAPDLWLPATSMPAVGGETVSALWPSEMPLPPGRSPVGLLDPPRSR